MSQAKDTYAVCVQRGSSLEKTFTLDHALPFCRLKTLYAALWATVEENTSWVQFPEAGRKARYREKWIGYVCGVEV